MNLPLAYKWLGQEGAPRHLLKAVELYGVTEAIGSSNNPAILGWAKELGIDDVYNADSIPWCGLYIAIIMQRAGRQPVKDPLWAANWSKFGVESKVPMLGDVLVFTRSGGGHVGLYVGEDNQAYHVLGGNQGDKVSVVRIAKARMTSARRPVYNVQPINIRKVVLKSNGKLSTNEA